jgi:hypothetical protein
VKVVALVSSSADLAAIQQVLSDIPTDLPTALVVLRHSAPDRATLLTEILQLSTGWSFAGCGEHRLELEVSQPRGMGDWAGTLGRRTNSAVDRSSSPSMTQVR